MDIANLLQKTEMNVKASIYTLTRDLLSKSLLCKHVNKACLKIYVHMRAVHDHNNYFYRSFVSLINKCYLTKEIAELGQKKLISSGNFFPSLYI